MGYTFRYSMAGTRPGAPPATHGEYLTHLVAVFLDTLQVAGWHLRGSSTQVSRAAEDVPAVYNFSCTVVREDGYPSTGPTTPERLGNAFRTSAINVGFTVDNYSDSVS